MLEYIHRSKTAALIRAFDHRRGTLRWSAGGRRGTAAAVRRNDGWAFQVTDDILDVEESSAALGKTAGKDIAQQKATYPAVYGKGIAEARLGRFYLHRHGRAGSEGESWRCARARRGSDQFASMRKPIIHSSGVAANEGKPPL